VNDSQYQQLAYKDYGTSTVVDQLTYQAAVDDGVEWYGGAYGPYLPREKHAPILDVGCGQGHCIAWLRRWGYSQVEGVDYSASMINIAHHHLGQENLHLIEDLRAFLGEHPDAYAAITLNQVMEHFAKSELLANLMALRQSLRPGGVLLIQVPNMCAFGGVRHRYMDLTHEIGFTEDSVHQALRLAGFVKTLTLPTLLPLRGGPKRLAYRILQRWQEAWLSWQYLIAMGSSRPHVVTGTLTAIAYRPE
jgi:2-polyprenyl-3-methyl-5-hydroxy-6-metoxy-1,4-benzoquinol methylase